MQKERILSSITVKAFDVRDVNWETIAVNIKRLDFERWSVHSAEGRSVCGNVALWVIYIKVKVDSKIAENVTKREVECNIEWVPTQRVGERKVVYILAW